MTHKESGEWKELGVKTEFWGLFTFLSREEMIWEGDCAEIIREKKAKEGNQWRKKVNGVDSSRKSDRTWVTLKM